MNGAEYVFGAKTERERAAEKPVFEFGFAPEKKRIIFALQTFLWESVIKTLPEIASKFFFTSSRCELPYQLPLLISLRSGIKSQSIVETIFLTFYGRSI